MSIAVSPMATDPASPMILTMTPVVEPRGQGEEGEEERQVKEADSGQRYEKPPPLHTGADWKVVLHLPEIETWLRMTTERVRDLTHSVQQDAENKHVDVYLVQLKDICEDISDHVEQIHALLETEFSLKLLSYSVNIIVDIHTVQLLWHQLRVSVLVLKERVLQGLQDSNGNFTRQTDILQAFSEDKNEARLDSLTEVDDSGQLTIKCSQDYFSLDCGITAFELSDYSPSEDLPTELDAMNSSRIKSKTHEACYYPDLEKDFPELIQSVGLLTVAAERLSSKQEENIANQEGHSASTPEIREESSETSKKSSPLSGIAKTSTEPSAIPDNSPAVAIGTSCQTHQSVPKSRHHSHCESSISKRPIRDCFNYNEVSPTQPSLPKKAMYLEGMSRDDIESVLSRIHPSSLLIQAEMSRSTPSLLDPPDRSKFCLELTSVYPSNTSSSVSQSYDCLNKISDKNCKVLMNASSYKTSLGTDRLNLTVQRGSSETDRPSDLEDQSSYGESRYAPSTDSPHCCNEISSSAHNDTAVNSHEVRVQSLIAEDDQSYLPGSPIHSNQKDSNAGSPKSALTSLVPLLPKDKHERSPNQSNGNSKKVEPWYGSDEYLALPAQLKKTEMLAQKLENLAKVLPQKRMEETIQDIDDWELSEVNSDFEAFPPFQPNRKYEKAFGSRTISPTSSSDIAPSLDESIESGPLSDLLSEDELPIQQPKTERCDKEKVQKGWVEPASCDTDDPSLSKLALIQQLLEDIHHQDNYEDIWEKIEGFVSKLDEFICWLHKALEATENWTPPMAETDSLKLYLETHLSFKLNVDSHCSLKDVVVEEGSQLLELIVSHKSGLKDMLQMILSQWQELQRQIKRQHSWILRALEIIKAEILASDVSQEDEYGTGSPKGEAQLCDLEARRDVVEQMSLKLYSEQYSNSTKRKKEFAEMSKVNRIGSNSLLDFELEYQELWDWLIDMESIVMDSHDLMMSEEQQQHLYKGNSVEMAMWQPKKTQLLGRVESLKRSGAVLPTDLEDKVGALTKKWDLLEKSLGERMPGTGTEQTGVGPRDLLSPETGSLVRQLEVRIKELKGWLRDTELFIFNSCLRKEEETLYTQKQLQYFKSLCCEIRQRRRGIASVLRLCQRLLDDQNSCTLDSERQSMQLTIVNLERRWEAIVMQAIQWQTRLQKKLGTEQVPMNIIESAFMDVNGSAEDSWEWDETDISNNLISVNTESRDLDKVQSPTSNLTTESLRSAADNPQFNQYVSGHGSSSNDSILAPPSSSPQIYQVYSLHNMEFFHRPHGPFLKKTPEYPKQPNVLLKSLSKDSSFSSTESLPDLLGGIISVKDGKYVYCGDVVRQSESESGIVSEGDTETTANSEICLLSQFEEPAQCSELKPSLNRARVYSEDTEELTENVDSQVSHKNCTKLSGNKQNSLEEKERIDGSHQSPFKYENQSVEIYVNDHESLIETESEFESHACCAGRDDERLCCDLRNDKLFAFLSQGSSLDSLSVAGDLFTSSKDVLHRSTSLESWLVSGKSTEEFSSQHSLEEFGLSGDSIGELSKRTLDLLKRLENIQNPSNQKMKRSVSDITLQSNSLKIHPTGQMSLDIASSINGDSAASLTELSSSEDVSLCSEDLAVEKNRIVDSNASFRKHVNHALPDEADVSISMIVNVSCASACTDDDEDDSDLLSSSTLTLTEEELGIKDDDDDSSIATDDEYIESSFVLGLDYMKNELQNWIKPKISQSREKNEFGLGDELQCGTLSHENITSTSTITVNERRFLSKAALKLLESNANGKIDSVRQKDLDIKKKNTQEDPTSYRNQFVDDVENGNVENAQLKGKDDEEEVLREEESIFISSGEPLKECYETDLVAGCSVGTVAGASSVKCDLLSSPPKEYSLEGQLRGEIPCYSSSRPKMNCHGSSQCTRQMINEDSTQDSHSTFLMDAEDKNTTTIDSPCCGHYSHVNKEENNDDDSSVHNFVMEIIDMASEALKNKAQSDPEAASPTPVAQIRDKVLEHSHRPIQLRKGDFYSYLSLSSHDSDCGEVSTCSEEKSSTPVPVDLNDGFEVKHGELLFEPCSEEVYISPPLCYNRSNYQRPSASGERVSASSTKPQMNDCSLPCNGVDTVCSANQKASSISKGTTARSQLECHNEASYLNPLPCETLIDTVECFSDTEMLESNISPVMTKIRDSCSSTNPLKEEDSLYINPKINCPQIRQFDRDEKGPASQWMKQKHVKKGCSSDQETKSARKQLPRSERYTKDDQKQAKGGNTCADSSDHPEP